MKKRELIEIVGNLSYWTDKLEEWNDKHKEDLKDLINELFYNISFLEGVIYI